LRPCLIILTVALIILPTADTALSDVASELQAMFDSLGVTSTSSSSGAYHSQSRGYVMGGSAVARTPTKYVTPLVLQAPDLKAGCGGIDAMFGGYSYINSEELKTFLQNAGTQAMGFAFIMALEAVCPTCRSILDTLKKLADTVNKFGLDSCNAAKAAVNIIGEKPKAYLQDAFSEWGKLQNDLWDPVKSRLEWVSKSLDEQHAKIYEKARDPRNPMRTSVSTMENLGTGLTEGQMELAISILGTMAPNQMVTEDGTEMMTADCWDIPPVLTVRDLMEGSQADNPLKILKCGNGSFNNNTCQKIVKENYTFSGYKKMSRDILYGIRDKIIASEPLTTEQKTFINSTNIPIMSALKTALNTSPEVGTAMIENITDLTALSYAMHVFRMYIGLYKLSAQKPLCGDVPRERYQLVQEDFRKHATEYAANLEIIEKVVALLRDLDRRAYTTASMRLRAAMTEVGW